MLHSTSNTLEECRVWRLSLLWVFSWRSECFFLFVKSWRFRRWKSFVIWSAVPSIEGFILLPVIWDIANNFWTCTSHNDVDYFDDIRWEFRSYRLILCQWWIKKINSSNWCWNRHDFCVLIDFNLIGKCTVARSLGWGLDFSLNTRDG